MALWTFGDRPPTVAPAPFGRGVLVGDFYARTDGRRFDRRQSARDLALQPKDAAHNCLTRGFGRYVIFWPEPDGDGVTLLRDPSGGMDVAACAIDGGA